MVAICLTALLCSALLSSSLHSSAVAEQEKGQRRERGGACDEIRGQGWKLIGARFVVFVRGEWSLITQLCVFPLPRILSKFPPEPFPFLPYKPYPSPELIARVGTGMRTCICVSVIYLFVRRRGVFVELRQDQWRPSGRVRILTRPLRVRANLANRLKLVMLKRVFIYFFRNFVDGQFRI